MWCMCHNENKKLEHFQHKFGYTTDILVKYVSFNKEVTTSKCKIVEIIQKINN